MTISEQTNKGLVIRNTGSHYTVAFDEGTKRDCRIKGNFRLKGIRTTNPVAVGDHVVVEGEYIVKIEPRRNYIIRRASNLSKEAHIIAANIDRAFLVVTLSHPTTSTTFIDRFLATAEAYRVPVTIVINKTDILSEEPEGLDLLDAVEHLYKSIGYDVIRLCALTKTGLDSLRERLEGKVSLLSGNSGVGKSTIINDLIPGAELATAPVSDVHDTGMHTTTFSQMLPLPGMKDSYIIDTPGVKGFGTIDFTRGETAHYFPEIFKISENCRYSNCTHTHEPGCAVLEAVEDHRISESRYVSYLSILEDTDPDKYRKAY